MFWLDGNQRPTEPQQVVWPADRTEAIGAEIRNTQQAIVGRYHGSSLDAEACALAASEVA